MSKWSHNKSPQSSNGTMWEQISFSGLNSVLEIHLLSSVFILSTVFSACNRLKLAISLSLLLVWSVVIFFLVIIILSTLAKCLQRWQWTCHLVHSDRKTYSSTRRPPDQRHQSCASRQIDCWIFEKEAVLSCALQAGQNPCVLN